MKFEHIIGIDVSKATVDFCILGEVQSDGTLENRPKKLQLFFKSLKLDPRKTLVCLEHTGVYNIHLVEVLCKLGFHVWLESALRIKRSIGMVRGKSDKIDAGRIAKYAFLHQEQANLWIPSREIIKSLKSLLSQRARLIKAKLILITPIEELAGLGLKKNLATLKRSFRSSLAALKNDIKALTSAIHKVILSDEKLKELFSYITSVPNIGPITAAKILVSTDEFNKIIDAKKYACHVGVAPFEHTSGTSLKGKSRVSHLANKEMKTMLHLASLSSISRSGEFKDYFDRRVKEGKNKMLVINAIRNKLIHRIFACVKEKRNYVKKSLEVA